jgi:hypothetical protein
MRETRGGRMDVWMNIVALRKWMNVLEPILLRTTGALELALTRAELSLVSFAKRIHLFFAKIILPPSQIT